MIDSDIPIISSKILREKIQENSIRIVDGSSSNIKITTQEDLELANYYLKQL